jgi:Tol biopolymer transport system component
MYRPPPFTRALALIGLLIVAASAAATPLPAQYFGRNKVQYRTFDFKVLKSPHFDVYFYPEEEAAARDAARMAERWYARLSRLFDHKFEERQPLILYAAHPDFQQTGTLSGIIGEGTGGFTEVFKQRVVMPFAYSYEETDHVLGHELVHAFQYDISGLGRAGGGLEAAAQRYQVPSWFTEGMAEYLSVGPVDPLTAMWVRDAALEGNLPTIEKMTYDPNIFPYRWGQALWAYVGGRWGDAAIGQILKLSGQGVPFDEAFVRVLNLSLEQLTADWHTSIRRAYLPMLRDRREAREIARPLITQNRAGGRLNVAPSLSPDGRYVAFISEMDYLDAELYLADAQTGRVIRRLQKGAAFDPHFGSLRYINSAGTWSPDSKRFAFSAQRGGHDVLAIIEVANGRRTREIDAPGVGEISNPTWSPDGESIVFAGMHGGISDLFRVDLKTGRVEPLTDDAFSELHPTFSPDGRTIAFTTDRGPDTELERLVYGPYRLALLDLATRQIMLVPGVDGSKSINPAWTPDGTGLYYISNRSGIPNVYRVTLATGELSRITNLFTGVSGITDVSPALTAARTTDRLLFTNFEDGGYNIYSLSSDRELAGTPAAEEAGSDAPAPAFLPPVPRPTEATFNRVTEYLANADAGLPSRADVSRYAVVDYRPRLGLDYLGQPTVGASTGGAFGGGGVYGGIAGIFSDVLGRHNLFGAVQAQGQLDEIGFAVQYINARRRWNLGAAAQRLPYIFGYYQAGVDSAGPSPVPTQDIVRARYFDTSVQGYAQYPFSAVKRAEFTAGARRIGTDYQIYRFLLDPGTLVPVDQKLVKVDGYSLNMLQASAALVYDNTLFGYTSPFAGQRYRFEISPVWGDLHFVDALADYRRYLYLRPVTLAFQGVHSGRYGRDSEGVVGDQRIFYDQYLGQPWYVRGYYDTYNNCSGAGGEGASCVLLDQLFGSRIGVAKAELRFPLVRQLEVASGIGVPPIEGFGFFDAGVAWTNSTRPILARGIPADPLERGIMSSAGVGARMNVFGYLIVELDYVRAFALQNGWRWQFNLLPGY